jgi:hypothetical protein
MKRIILLSSLLSIPFFLACSSDDDVNDGDAVGSPDGGSSNDVNDDDPVSSLDEDALAALCEEFHDEICETSEEEFCVDSCRATCRDEGTPALIQAECVEPITVGAVRECARLIADGDEGAFEFCTMGGGCMFDVLDETCL